MCTLRFARHPTLVFLQDGAQLLVALSSIVITALAARRMLQVREWAQSVECLGSSFARWGRTEGLHNAGCIGQELRNIIADNFNERMLRGLKQTSPMAVDAGGGVYPLSKRRTSH